MRLNIHPAARWIPIAALAAAALATVNAQAQSTGPNAAFEGRPAMAGPQAGEGALAGPPQGGVGPQSRDDPRGGIELWKPRRDSDRDLRRDPGGVGAPGSGGELKPQRDRDAGDVVKRPRDTTGLNDQGDAGRTMKRATKRTMERARRGVSGIDG